MRDGRVPGNRPSGRAAGENLLTNAQPLKYETARLLYSIGLRVIRDAARPLPGTFFIDTFTARYRV